MIKRRRYKYIYRRWMLMQGKLPWKKPSLERVVDYMVWKRFYPNMVSERAW